MSKQISTSLSKQRNLATTGGVLVFTFFIAGIFHEQLTPFFNAYIKLFGSPIQLWNAVTYVVSSLFFSILSGMLLVSFLGIPIIFLSILIDHVKARLK